MKGVTMKLILIMVCSTSVAYAGMALAQTVSGRDDVGALQGETFLAQVKAAQQIAQAKVDAASPPKDVPNTLGAAGTVTAPAATPYFANGVFFAEVVLPEGGTILAHEGDVLPGGAWVVKSITSSRAVVTRVMPLKGKGHDGR